MNETGHARTPVTDMSSGMCRSTTEHAHPQEGVPNRSQGSRSGTNNPTVAKRRSSRAHRVEMLGSSTSLPKSVVFTGSVWCRPEAQPCCLSPSLEQLETT
ncbi:unnamed protein product [Protopolystoma xenopodis]|uniref:Uncharacterized protein n=1 Tax=Protopolystoma xenopodis TaxID=117903 RepID=A0A3S5C143_9PLAT|nr:unnamed protein product [Protopolystoma xenopodis]